MEIVATCDAERYADEVAQFKGNRPEVYESVDEMLRAGRAQAADVRTPHYLHHVVALKCIAAGVAVRRACRPVRSPGGNRLHGRDIS